MSLASTLRKAAYAAPLAFALAAANANAALPIIEPDTADLSKPLPSYSCFVTNEKGTAFDKLVKAMNARNQTIVATADQVLPTGKRAQIFTSARDGSEAYDIGLNTPKDQMKDTDKACFRTVKGVNIYNVYSLNGVPNEVNKGELGIGLASAFKSGTKVVITGVLEKNGLYVVTYNPEKGHGTVILSDANGNRAGEASIMSSVAYTKKAREFLGIDQSVALANQPK